MVVPVWLPVIASIAVCFPLAHADKLLSIACIVSASHSVDRLSEPLNDTPALQVASLEV